MCTLQRKPFEMWAEKLSNRFMDFCWKLEVLNQTAGSSAVRMMDLVRLLNLGTLRGATDRGAYSGDRFSSFKKIKT
jgi:hypothetical protein